MYQQHGGAVGALARRMQGWVLSRRMQGLGVQAPGVRVLCAYASVRVHSLHA